MSVLDLMSEYFDAPTKQMLISESASSTFHEWESVNSPERLIRDYSFSTRSNTLEFLRQLFLYEDAVNHHAKITIDYDTVRIEVGTHDIDAITELDIEYTTVSDQIFVDTNSVGDQCHPNI